MIAVDRSLVRVVFIVLVFVAMQTIVFAQSIPTPESVLGHKPGDDFYLATYDESLDYFKKLDAATDKLQLVNVGKTSEGRDWYIALISTADNLRNLEKYREMAKRVALVKGLNDQEARRVAREGKAIVHIDGGLHSTEVAHAQHTIQLAYNLVTSSDTETQRILDNVILVLWFSINPDGQNMTANWYRRNLGTPYEVSQLPWLYQKYVGHDNNRDGYMNNMIESQVVTRVTVRELFPMVFYNHHQTAPFPARIWIPPFAEPVSTNMHPLMWRWTNVFGTAMAAYLDGRGMDGAIHQGKGFDDWYPGFIDNVNNYRHTISFLTETALYRYATPHFYTVQDFPKDFQDLRKEVFYSSPWKGGWWRLGDAVRYMIAASMSVLDTSAKYREEIIYNRYQAGRDVISQFTKEPPYAYVIPQRQRDPQTAATLLEKLQINGLEISQATAPITANGREYPAGTWVVMMNQPYALLVKDLLDVQRYPDLRDTPGGAPDLPYDVAGWTLPLQMGVDVHAVTMPLGADFAGKLRVLERITAPAGGVEGSGAIFVFDHQSNAAFKAVNSIFRIGGGVAIANKEITVNNTRFAPGAFVVSNISRDRMQSLANELTLKVQATARAAENTTAIKAPRIGVYIPWVSSMDAGWTQWLLDQHNFAHAELHNADVQAGHLNERFDVILIAEMSTPSILEGHKIGTIPGEFVGGIGESGLTNLREFVRSGGTLVTLGSASEFAIEQFSLPVKNALKGLKNEDFFCSGSILRAEVKDANHPLTAGLPAEPSIFFARNGAFVTARDFKGSVLITHIKEGNPLLSGYILKPEKLNGKAAALDVNYGRGHVILSGFRPQWRGQTHGMFKFLFNSLFYFGAAAPAASSGETQPLARGGRENDWSKLAGLIHADLGKAFEQNQKFTAARGAQATAEGKRYDELIEKFQTAHFAALDEFKSAKNSRKLDEYKTQLKAALIDMRGKDYSAAKFTANDVMIQFRLSALEQEIAELIKAG
ncbi:MAG: M14 metallopeptidase family protein [Blastocatellales bacterium]